MRMLHGSRWRTGTGMVLAVGLLAPVGLAQAAAPEPVARDAVDGTGLGHTTLAWQGGRSEQQLGQVLNPSACDLDADGHDDLVAGVAQGYGRDGFADMAAARHTAGYQDAFIDLPQWWSSHQDAAAGGWACADDVNADGFADVVQIPAATARTVSLNLFGAERNAAGRLLDSRVRNYQFAVGSSRLAQTAAGAAGDLDGDGRGDVVVSQHTASTAERSGNGRLWVLAGVDSPTVPEAVRTVTVGAQAPSSDVVAVIDGAGAGDALGTATPAGDVDGDGLEDLVVAAPASGKVWLIRGREATSQARQLDLANLDPADGVLWASGPPGLGSALAIADDVNGDDRADLVLGSADGVTSTGGAAVVFGAAEILPVTVDPVATTVRDAEGAAGYWIAAAADGDGLGHSVAALGDLDGDGRSDLLLGAPGHDVDGAAYVLRGRSDSGAQSLATLTATDGYRIDGTRGAAQAADRPSRFGYRVSAIGDVDGNGLEDFAIGAPGHSDHASYRYGGIAVALRGELDASLDLVVSRRVGDSGTPVTDASSVLPAGELVDLRANLRINTGQGVGGEVDFTLDGSLIEGCAAVPTASAAPHRAFAFCEQGIALNAFGRHEIGAVHHGEPGRWSWAEAESRSVLVTDAATVALRVERTDDTRAALAEVRAASSTTVVEAGTLRFTVDGEPLPGCGAVAVRGGLATCALPADADLATLRADFSGIAVPSPTDPETDVVVLTPAEGKVWTAPGISLTLSRTAVGYGDALTARPQLAPLPVEGQGPYTVEILLGGRTVGQAPAPTATAKGIALPRTITVGSHGLVAVLRDAEGTEVSRSAEVRLRVAKATLGRVKAVAPRFKPGTRPRLSIVVPRLSNGSQPVGTLRVTVRGSTLSKRLTAADRGKVRMRLPQQRRAVRAKVRFIPAASAQAATPAATSVTLRPRR